MCFGCQHFFVGLIAPNFKSISTQTLFDNFFEAFRDLLLFYFATKTAPELISAIKSDLAELLSQGLSGSRTLNSCGTVTINLQGTILPLLENEIV